MKTQRQTPEAVIMKMVYGIIDIMDTNSIKILEPSAGEGAIADYIFNHCLDEIENRKKDIHCVELNKDKYERLVAKGYTAYHGDFLDDGILVGNNDFDYVVAAPPFRDNIDLKHIMKMYDLLKVNGALVTLTSPFWLVNNEKHQVEFREWLKGKNHFMKMLPDNTFIEKGKTVPTAILKITKYN